MIKQFHANKARLQRHLRIRNRVEGSPFRPRLNVFRSGNHIYAQVIDDATGITLVAASSLDESLRDFKPTAPAVQKTTERAEASVEMAAEVAPAKGKGAKAEKPAPKAAGQPQKGAQAARGGRPGQGQVKTVLPTAQKSEAKTPVEALAAIANNRKVAIAREVGKLIGLRAKEKGVARVVFDRGGYAYHGRVAALAEGAREAGLDF
jgi:ribosomal protein L18